jgi:hypothetical protein
VTPAKRLAQTGPQRQLLKLWQHFNNPPHLVELVVQPGARTLGALLPQDVVLWGKCEQVGVGMDGVRIQTTCWLRKKLPIATNVFQEPSRPRLGFVLFGAYHHTIEAPKTSPPQQTESPSKLRPEYSYPGSRRPSLRPSLTSSGVGRSSAAMEGCES